jgi:transposase-like protein
MKSGIDVKLFLIMCPKCNSADHKTVKIGVRHHALSSYDARLMCSDCHFVWNQDDSNLIDLPRNPDGYTANIDGGKPT